MLLHVYSLDLPYLRKVSFNAFKAVCLFNPAKVTDLQPDATIVEELKYFYFLEQALPDLKKELPTYISSSC